MPRPSRRVVLQERKPPAASNVAEDHPVIRPDLTLRFIHDEAVLLLPEREEACVLNHQAAAILQLCDGTRTVGDVIAELRTRFSGDEQQMAADIHACLTRLRELRVLT